MDSNLRPGSLGYVFLVTFSPTKNTCRRPDPSSPQRALFAGCFAGGEVISKGP